jgi:hypothetical protein
MTNEELLKETAELVPDRVVMRRKKGRRRSLRPAPMPCAVESIAPCNPLS